MFAWLIATVLVVVYVVTLGIVVRWLLGAPVGAVRTLLTGIVGFFVILPAMFVLVGDAGLADTERMASEDVAIGDVVIVLVAILWILALGAAFLAGLEFVWPSERSVGLLARARGGRDRMRRTLRYIEIVRIAMRHGFGPLLRGGSVRLEELGAPLVSALNEAGVTFVKLGQLLASRRDIVPQRLAADLATLQTQADAESWDTVGPLLERELGRPLDAVFATIDPIPLAAASIGQVHAGMLLSGERVVAKIQRPNARAQVEVDIDIALRLCRRLEDRSESARRIGVRRLMEGLAQSLRDELDYRVEGRNIALMRSAAARSGSDLLIPRGYPELSTARILVMERVGGQPLGSSAASPHASTSSDRHGAAVELVDGVLHQILVDGIFHADLHAGNIMVRDDGGLGLIDFGSVAIIDREQRELLLTFLSALRAEDAYSATVAIRHLSMSEPRDDQDLRRDLGELFTITAVERDTAQLSDRLLRLFHRHQLALPGNLAAAVRTMATLQDAIASLDSRSEYADLILERVHHVARGLLDPQRARMVATAQAMTTAQYLRRLPNNLDAFTEAQIVHVRTRRARERGRRSWSLRIFLALIGCGFGVLLGVAASVLVLHGGGPTIPPNVSVLPVIGALLGAAAVVIGTRSAIVLKRLSTAPSSSTSSRR